MFDSNDLADNRPFFVEIAGKSGLHSNPSVRADALRLTEDEDKPGASALRLTEEEGTGASAHRLMGTNDKLEAYPTCFAGTGASAPCHYPHSHDHLVVLYSTQGHSA